VIRSYIVSWSLVGGFSHLTACLCLARRSGQRSLKVKGSPGHRGIGDAAPQPGRFVREAPTRTFNGICVGLLGHVLASVLEGFYRPAFEVGAASAQHGSTAGLGAVLGIGHCQRPAAGDQRPGAVLDLLVEMMMA
jgi:hypothetical protein